MRSWRRSSRLWPIPSSAWRVAGPSSSPGWTGHDRLSLAEIAQTCPRLARRLQTPAGSRPGGDPSLDPLRAGGPRLPGGSRIPGTRRDPGRRLAGSWFRGPEKDSGRPSPGCPHGSTAQGIAPDLEAAAHRAPRRPNWQLAADRFYADAARRQDYLSPGQKASVRAVSAARSGDSVICVLPTGSGKTDVILARACPSRPRQSCLIVPTVALALDLEARIQGHHRRARQQFAYHGGLPAQKKTDLAQRLRDGVQWLIITSPEAACTALARPLEAAAAEGRLDLFAIDEAHIVAEWGDAFRPAFHTLAGLRRRLINRAPAGRRAGHRDADRHP